MRRFEETSADDRQIVGVKQVSLPGLSLDQESENTRLQGIRQGESLDATNIGRADINAHALGPSQGPRLRGKRALGRNVSMSCITLAHLGQRIAVSCHVESGS